MPSNTFQEILQEYDLRIAPLADEYDRLIDEACRTGTGSGKADDAYDEFSAARNDHYEEVIEAIREKAPLLDAAQELADALEWITRCPKLTVPCGTTFYGISEARMQAAKAAIAKAKGEPCATPTSK